MYEATKTRKRPLVCSRLITSFRVIASAFVASCHGDGSDSRLDSLCICRVDVAVLPIWLHGSDMSDLQADEQHLIRSSIRTHAQQTSSSVLH